MDKECALYKITVDGLAYWGIAYDPAKRWREHQATALRGQNQSRLYRALRSAQPGEPRIEIVTWCRNQRVAAGLEAVAIKLGLGALNVMPGGSTGGKGHSAETRKKIGAAHRGQKRSAWARANISRSHVGNKNCVGRVMSEETRRRISETKRARNAERKKV